MGVRSSHPSTVQHALGVEHKSLPGGGQCVLGWVCEALAHWWVVCVAASQPWHSMPPECSTRNVARGGPHTGACQGSLPPADSMAGMARRGTAWHDMAGMWHMPAVPAVTRASRLPHAPCPVLPSPAPCMQRTHTAYYSLRNSVVRYIKFAAAGTQYTYAVL